MNPSSRNAIIAGNWKMHYGPRQAAHFAREIVPVLGQVISLIRRLLEERYGNEAAAMLRILYGGSVTSANISEFIAHPDIDGALVGGASITHDFVEIVRKTAEAMQRCSFM